MDNHTVTFYSVISTRREKEDKGVICNSVSVELLLQRLLCREGMPPVWSQWAQDSRGHGLHGSHKRL